MTALVAALATSATVVATLVLSFQSSASRPPRDSASDGEIVEALGAVQAADGYQALAEAIERYDDVLASVRVVTLVDEELRAQTLDRERRGLLILLRELSLDCRERGGAAAGRLLAVRVIAGAALAADTPQQFAAVLEKFSPLASEIDAALVRRALSAPPDTWPPGLLPLMEQLALDWPSSGAAVAATRLAEAAGNTSSAGAPSSAPAPAVGLAGHWRSTRITFDQPRDEHLVLREDGVAETWTVTAGGREPSKRGRWSDEDRSLVVNWEDGSTWGQPYTFHEGQLVFPNVQNRRQFWDRIE